MPYRKRIHALLLVFILPFSIQVCAFERIAPQLSKQARSGKLSSGAEVLWSTQQTSVQADGHKRSVFYVSLRLNDIEAVRDYGRIEIPFNHYYSEAKVDFANVLSADGVVNSVASDAMQLRVTGGGQDFYSDSSAYVFSLPNLAVGALIEFQFTVQSQRLALAELVGERVSPHWYQRTLGQDSGRMDSVRNHVFELSLPQSMQLYEKRYGGYPTSSKQWLRDDQLTRRWQLRDVPALVSEPWMPRYHHLAPMLSLSSHRDWSVVDNWTWHNIVDKFAGDDAIKAIAASFKLGATASREDKTKAVYAYLQNNIRYVFAHLGRGGYEPHFAREVLKSGYGDCKDQTILALALLHALGVDAHAALVETPRGGQRDTELVSLIFDHMLVYIPASDGAPELWMDTTGDRALYPGMSNYLKGQTALIVDGAGGRLTDIESGFAPNQAKLVLDYHPGEQGQTLVDARIHLSGYFEQNLRNWWIASSTRESDLEKFLSDIFGDRSHYRYRGEALHMDDLWQPIELRARFTFPADEDPQQPAVYAASIHQIYRLYGELKNLQVPQTRVNRFQDNYPYSLHMQVNMVSSTEHLPTLIQSSGDLLGKYVSLYQSGKKIDDRYQVNLQLDRPVLDLSASEYREYYRELENLANPLPWVVSMLPDEQLASQHKLAEIGNQKGAHSIEYTLAQTRQYIEDGRFNEALASASQAVKIDENNGEAWYLLGMAQGMNTLIEESTRSFARAQSLGYLP